MATLSSRQHILTPLEQLTPEQRRQIFDFTGRDRSMNKGRLPDSPSRSCAFQALIIAFGLVVCCLASVVSSENELNWPIRQWQAQTGLNNIYQRVANMPIEGVTLIDERKPGTGDPGLGGTMMCVYGGARQMYSSTRPYSDIAEDYITEFTRSGWQWKFAFADEDDTEDIVFYKPGEPFYHLIVGLHERESGYLFIFDYADCCEFCPDWRFSDEVQTQQENWRQDYYGDQ